MVLPSLTELAMKRHADPVWHVCFLHFGKTADAQDAFQETFLKLLAYEGEFSDEEHEKAWLIRVAANVCKDMLKRADRKRTVAHDEVDLSAFSSNDPLDTPGSALSEVMAAMMQLPREQRTALYLCSVQGFTADEVACVMGCSSNTVYSWVSRARSRLKEVLA